MIVPFIDVLDVLGVDSIECIKLCIQHFHIEVTVDLAHVLRGTRSVVALVMQSVLFF